MNVLQLSTMDVLGGAARAAYRLHQGLKRSGIDSEMLVRFRHSIDPDIEACDAQNGIRAWAGRIRHPRIAWSQLRLSRSTAPNGELVTLDRSTMGPLPLKRLHRPDIIHLHWIANFVDLPTTLVPLANTAPLVWTLHDMNPFTGGCHYVDGCNRYDDRCGLCPQLGSSKVRDASRSIWKRKQRVYGQIAAHRLHVVTPSRWLGEQVARSSLLGRYPRCVIPYGLDTEVFHPVEICEARKALDLPGHAKILLFVADSLRDQRKGFEKLIAAMKQLSGVSNLLLLTIGGQCPQLPQSCPHRHLGRIADDALLSKVYSAADVFVIPSLQDNLPNTVMESLACGTPVVGFDIGGIPDMVRMGKTGLVVPLGNVNALANAIDSLLANDSLREQMGTQARQVAIEEYDLAVQAASYRRLYEQLVASTRDVSNSPAGESRQTRSAA